MTHATGTRLAAAFFLFISFLPPWIHALLSFPIGVGLWKKARDKEKAAERRQAALEQLADQE